MGSRGHYALLCLSLSVFTGGCASTRSPDWYEGVKPPDWAKVRDAAFKSATQRSTWVPLAAAAFLQIDNFDNRISDWARDNTPIFGDTTRAEDFSNTEAKISNALYLVSLSAVECPGGLQECTLAKGQQLSIALAGNLFQQKSVSALKDLFGRERPVGGARSFPSGAATDAGYMSELTRGNLRNAALPERGRQFAGASLYALEGLSAWSRVEAGAHYPSDVLVGMAMGHFIASFVNEMWIHDRPEGITILGGPPGSIGLGLRYEF